MSQLSLKKACVTRKHCSNVSQSILIRNSGFQENAKTKVYALEDSLGVEQLQTPTMGVTLNKKSTERTAA